MSAATKTPAKAGKPAKTAPAAASTPAKDQPTAAEQGGVKTRPPSIRSTINRMLDDGKSTAEITEVLKAQFPNSKAAAKSSKHIAFYRSQRKGATKA
jgi:hypothetical protein